MKRILIVNKSFEVGGIQSSMANMANELGKYYQVDLFVYNPIGVMKERLNAEITVLEPSWRFKSLAMTLKETFKSRNLKWIVFRIFSTIWTKLFSNKLPIRMALKHQKSLEGYDLAIAYHQEQRKKSVLSGFTRVVDECVIAPKKIAWLHFDSKTIDLDSNYNNQFYQKMDRIVCVSKSLMENFSLMNPSLSAKMEYCYNFINYDSMKAKSEMEQTVPYPENRFICFCACRLTAEKALVRAIQALSDTFKKHRDVMWFIAGDGVERSNVEMAIEENGLNGRIVLLGNQSNPYPYMRHADLLLNVSYHEAAPMVYFESKALGVPVFTTKNSSSDELLQNGIDSFICENSDEGIRELFSYLMENRGLIASAKESLRSYSANNNESLAKINRLMS